MTISEQFKMAIGPCYYFNEGGDFGGGVGGSDGGDPSGGDGGADDGGGSGNDFSFDEFKNSYGKDYLERPYMKAIDSPERLFKELDNAQTLIGKKLSFPGAEATDKEHDEYLDLIRPKDKNVYKFSDSHLPDNLKGFHPEGFQEKISDLYQKAALTPKQASILSEGYDAIMLNFNGEALSKFAEAENARKVADADFDAMADKTWGQERTNVQDTAKALLEQFTPTDFKDHIANLTNENLIVMASVLKGVSDKYISQDDLKGLLGGSNKNMSTDSLREQAQKEWSELLNMDEFDPTYEEKRKKVNDLYSQIGKATGDK